MFPSLAAFNMSHVSLLAHFPLSHQASVTCLHFTCLSCPVFTLSVISHSLSAGQLLPAASFWHLYSAPTSLIFRPAPLSFSHATAQAWEEPAVNTIRFILSLSFKSLPKTFVLWNQEESSEWLHTWCTATVACHDSQAFFMSFQHCRLKEALSISSLWDLLFYVCATAMWTTLAKVVACPGYVVV